MSRSYITKERKENREDHREVGRTRRWRKKVDRTTGKHGICGWEEEGGDSCKADKNNTVKL